MTGINYITNDKGEKTALLIDLYVLKRANRSDEDINDSLEDLEDILGCELSDSEEYREWADVRQELKNVYKKK